MANDNDLSGMELKAADMLDLSFLESSTRKERARRGRESFFTQSVLSPPLVSMTDREVPGSDRHGIFLISSELPCRSGKHFLWTQQDPRPDPRDSSR